MKALETITIPLGTWSNEPTSAGPPRYYSNTTGREISHDEMREIERKLNEVGVTLSGVMPIPANKPKGPR